MKSIIVFESANRSGKRDGDEFSAQARKCADIWCDDGPVEMVDLGKLSKADKRAKVLQTLRTSSDIGRIGFFCHGFPTGISAGFNIVHVPQLVRGIDGCVQKSRRIDVYLFACLTGRGNFPGGASNSINTADRSEQVCTPREGFAMHLCYMLYRRMMLPGLLAHTTAGHTARNPYKVRIWESERTIYRRRICSPADKGDWAQWKKSLADGVTPFTLNTRELV